MLRVVTYILTNYSINNRYIVGPLQSGANPSAILYMGFKNLECRSATQCSILARYRVRQSGWNRALAYLMMNSQCAHLCMNEL